MKSEWIKLSDRLPEVGKPIWLCSLDAINRKPKYYEFGSRIPSDLQECGWTHWQPAEVPSIPEKDELSPEQEAWLDYQEKHAPYFSKEVFGQGFDAFKAGIAFAESRKEPEWPKFWWKAETSMLYRKMGPSLRMEYWDGGSGWPGSDDFKDKEPSEEYVRITRSEAEKIIGRKI